MSRYRMSLDSGWESNAFEPFKEVEFKTADKKTIVYSKIVYGEWIEDAETYYKALNERGLLVDEYTPYFVDDIACSECLAKFSVIDNETQFFKYCPNCGAMMSQECNT